MHYIKLDFNISWSIAREGAADLTHRKRQRFKIPYL